MREQYLLEMARFIFEALLSGDEVLRDGCRRLDQAMQIHHEEFMEVFPECAKPKLHTNRHTIDAMNRHKVNLSCMAAERKHKGAKQRGQHLFRGFDETLLKKELAMMTECITDTRAFMKIKLAIPEQMLALQSRVGLLLTQGGLDPSEFASSSSVVVGLKYFFKGDVLLWRDGGVDCVGYAVCFLKRDVQGALEFHAAVEKFRRLAADDVWSVMGSTIVVIDVERVIAPLPFIKGNDTVTVLMPAGLHARAF